MTNSKIEGLRKFSYRIHHCLKCLMGAKAQNPQVRGGNNFDRLNVMVLFRLVFHLDEVYNVVNKSMSQGKGRFSVN
jgi:hypothetical protein